MKYIGLGIAATLLVAALIYVRGYLNPAPAAPQANLPSQELQAAPVQEGAPRKLDLEELMPAEDLALIEAMEPVDHANMSEAELAKDQQPPSNSLKPTNLSSFEQPQKRQWTAAHLARCSGLHPHAPGIKPAINKNSRLYCAFGIQCGTAIDGFLFSAVFRRLYSRTAATAQSNYLCANPKRRATARIVYTLWVEGRLSIETKEHDLGLHPIVWMPIVLSCIRMNNFLLSFCN